MTTQRTTLLLLAIVVLGALTLACTDLDIDRSGFELTATAAPRTEMARRAADAAATQVAERGK